MQGTQQRWHKFLSLLALGFLIAIGVTACEVNTNTTTQICNGVVNVNSCTSSNSDAQNTVIAGWQQNTAQQQATAQANLDATVTAQASVQSITTSEENTISVGNIIIPLAFLVSIIAFFASFSRDQDSITVKIVTGIIAVSLLVMLIILFN